MINTSQVNRLTNTKHSTVNAVQIYTTLSFKVNTSLTLIPLEVNTLLTTIASQVNRLF